MRLVIITAILGMLTQPAWAENVYYCETTALAQITDEERVATIRPHRFKMAVSEGSVVIRGKDFHDIDFDKVENHLGGGFIAQRNRSIGFANALGTFLPPKLTVTLFTFGPSITSFKADCEKF